MHGWYLISVGNIHYGMHFGQEAVSNRIFCSQDYVCNLQILSSRLQSIYLLGEAFLSVNNSLEFS
jgi:hypothetical protein